MKKYSKIAYIILVLIILISIFFVYKVFAKNNESEDIKAKAMLEIQYIESQFQNLFNQLNNINFESYKISSSEIKSDKEESNSNLSSSSSSSSESEGSSKKSGESSGGSGESGGSKESSEGESTGDKKKYTLEEKGILTKDSDIDWNQIKNDVEKVYSYLPIMTLDLYQTSANQQDIIDFNNEYDNLIKTVKDENKEDTLLQISKLYDYIPKFAENSTNDESKKIVLKTKNNIFKAYSILEQEDWTGISKNINDAIQEFTKLVTGINSQDDNKQYNINKAYVMLNELQNAVYIKDKEVFLIKYKNLLEELQNI